MRLQPGAGLDAQHADDKAQALLYSEYFGGFQFRKGTQLLVNFPTPKEHLCRRRSSRNVVSSAYGFAAAIRSNCI